MTDTAAGRQGGEGALKFNVWFVAEGHLGWFACCRRQDKTSDQLGPFTDKAEADRLLPYLDALEEKRSNLANERNVYKSSFEEICAERNALEAQVEALTLERGRLRGQLLILANHAAVHDRECCNLLADTAVAGLTPDTEAEQGDKTCVCTEDMPCVAHHREEQRRRQQRWRKANPDTPDTSKEDEMDKGFHWQHGWYFKRLEDGEVRVIVDGDKGNPIVQAAIPAAEWASIVASVTPQGDNAETYQQATDLHGGA